MRVVPSRAAGRSSAKPKLYLFSSLRAKTPALPARAQAGAGASGRSPIATCPSGDAIGLLSFAEEGGDERLTREGGSVDLAQQVALAEHEHPVHQLPVLVQLGSEP